MIKKSTEFFKSVPPKVCANCGNKFDELHESYTNQCNRCLRKSL